MITVTKQETEGNLPPSALVVFQWINPTEEIVEALKAAGIEPKVWTFQHVARIEPEVAELTDDTDKLNKLIELRVEQGIHSIGATIWNAQQQKAEEVTDEEDPSDCR